MCGRFGLAVSGETLAELLELDDAPEVEPRYNIAPTQEVLAARRAKGGGRELATFRWGLVPFWADDVKIGTRFINARGETLRSKPVFRKAFERRRCLIPADGFYEWLKAGKQRRPFHVGVKGGRPFAMAGLWERWRRPDETWLESCTIVTTDANTLVKRIHHRMPVIVPPEAFATWLDVDAAPPDAVEALVQPYPADDMEVWPVSPHVGNVAHDDPLCRARQETLL